MAKFSRAVAPKMAAPVSRTTTVGPTETHEGGAGFLKDPKTALYTLAVTNMVSEATFYESAGERDNRFEDLVHQVTRDDPDWVAALIPWLRTTANMRSAPLVAALEYGHARGPGARGVVSSAMQRPDEPGEALGYWLSRHGRRMPMAVKRGIADGATRLYTEHAALKYDGLGHAVRLGDVIEYTHPKPVSPTQSALFRYLLDRRHGHFTPTPEALKHLAGVGLSRIAAAYELEAIPNGQRRAHLRERGHLTLAEAGFTWERLSGWLPGGMDAEAWEAIIPSMGYMALLRNLRNFEEAGVDKAVLAGVAAKLADPLEVARSRQLPYRFFSAYRNSGTTFFAPALEEALNHATTNVPIFPGRTLVMVDTSGSMSAPVSNRSVIRLDEIAALFAAAVGANSKTDLVIYADDHRRITRRPTSVLRATEQITNLCGVVGYGTNTWPSTLAHYDRHDRIVVFTDGQDHPARQSHLPDVPIYVWDLRGYRATNMDLTTPKRYLLSGFSDASFKLVGLLEAGHDAGWPWED